MESINKNNIPNIPAEKFVFTNNRSESDEKFKTKQIGYFEDAWNRFKKNKSSLTAAIIIAILILYAIIAPFAGSNTYTQNLKDTTYLTYTKLLPKCKLFEWAGWDGCYSAEIAEANLVYYNAIAEETGYDVITKIKKEYTTDDGKKMYDVKIDSYISNGFIYMTLTEEQYQSIQAWQNETGYQIIYPAITTKNVNDANIWYEANAKNVAVLKNGKLTNVYKTSGNDGNYNSLRIEGDPGLKNPEDSKRYRYATITGDSSSISYRCRVFKYTYFMYRYGFEPSFLFGTNALGQDIFTRLASGARFSFIFAICISFINLFIGSIYGAIEGYYGGLTDLIMERISDILVEVPFMIVATLFQLHLAKKVGPIWSLLFAFVLTGWIGMASRVRMQFYRFKSREYVLAARTLGANDRRLMFKHIFPNSLGTLITGCVMVIPGVIFSESSLTYLGIINLESSTMTSVGTMLANGKDYLATYPHIIFFPALFIALLEVSFNLFGNGLRDAFNPALRGADE
ncbi:MAG: ABC transporter permease [Sphaerochaetaceae bacterium]|nr:ABC transporter permease [Sphaerochaetaceae bacterium]